MAPKKLGGMAGGRPGPSATTGSPKKYTAQQRKVRQVRQALRNSSTTKAQAKKLAASLGGNAQRTYKTAMKRGALRSGPTIRSTTRRPK